MTSPQAISTTRPIAALSMSAIPRPAMTAEPAIGSERKRSVMPRLASVTIAVMVPSRPNTAVSASMPGTSTSGYDAPYPPRSRYANISSIRIGKKSPTSSTNGCRTRC